MKNTNGKPEIKWKAIQVPISKIKETPGNYKLFSEEGAARFRTSVESFGMAGTVILNADYVLIDGNSRIKKAKEMGHTKVWASMPDRKLSPKEFIEFAAMHDVARAGDADIQRIKDELGTTSSFFKKWNIEIPMTAEVKLQELEENEDNIKGNGTKPKEVMEGSMLRPIQLMLTIAESEEYIRIAESLYSRFKTDNVTDLSMKLMRFFKK